MSLTINNHSVMVRFSEFVEDTFKLNSLIKSMGEVCKSLDLTIVNFASHTFPNPKVYDDLNVEISNTGVFVLCTSHLAWHTFPEHLAIHVSISTCGNPIDGESVRNALLCAFAGIKEIEICSSLQ